MPTLAATTTRLDEIQSIVQASYNKLHDSLKAVDDATKTRDTTVKAHQDLCASFKNENDKLQRLYNHHVKRIINEHAKLHPDEEIALPAEIPTIQTVVVEDEKGSK